MRVFEKNKKLALLFSSRKKLGSELVFLCCGVRHMTVALASGSKKVAKKSTKVRELSIDFGTPIIIAVRAVYW